MESITIGSRVRLVSLEDNHRGVYPESCSNTIGNVGVIIKCSIGSSLPYLIKWDNGSVNSYNIHNIELEEKEEPKDIYVIAQKVLEEDGITVSRQTLKLIAYRVVFGELLFEVMQKEKLDLQTTGAIIAALNKAITGE